MLSRLGHPAVSKMFLFLFTLFIFPPKCFQVEQNVLLDQKCNKKAVLVNCTEGQIQTDHIGTSSAVQEFSP